MDAPAQHGAPYPSIGDRVSAIVTRTTASQAHISIFMSSGRPTVISYRGIIRTAVFEEGSYVCDRLKVGDTVEGIIISHGEGVLYVNDQEEAGSPS